MEEMSRKTYLEIWEQSNPRPVNKSSMLYWLRSRELAICKWQMEIQNLERKRIIEEEEEKKKKLLYAAIAHRNVKEKAEYMHM